MSKVKQLGVGSNVLAEPMVPGSLARLDPPWQPRRIEQLIQKWQHSSGEERANKDAFFLDLCHALGVLAPPPKGSLLGDPYCFEKDIKIPHPSGKITTGFADFYKADHFLIETKQGGTTAGKGTAKRGTAVYQKEMKKAFVQALAFVRNLATKPPFLLTGDSALTSSCGWGLTGNTVAMGQGEQSRSKLCSSLKSLNSSLTSSKIPRSAIQSRSPPE